MNKFIALGLTLASLASPPAAADESLDMGRDKARACTTCHGLDGLRQAPGQPAIGGRDFYDLLANMASFRNGDRFHPVMSVLMQTLDEADMAEVAEYFAGMDRSRLGEAGSYPTR